MTIRRQIAQGYAAVLGLALAGTTTGLLVGSYFQSQALKAQEVAIAERKLLSDLQIKIQDNRPTKQLSPHLSDADRLRLATNAMMRRTGEIRVLLERYEALREADYQSSSGEETQEHRALHELLKDYEVALVQFQGRLRDFARIADSLIRSGSDVAEVQKLLIAFVQSPEFAGFVALPEDLIPFVSSVEAQERLASEALTHAAALQIQIIFGSLLLSIAIATLIASYTSRLIGDPIQDVTKTAHRITQEGDFSLKVPVLGKGEVMSLANSFNQLTAKVNDLLNQVSQKNADLHLALKQLQQQQVQLLQAEKMSSLGKLVAGIAHEINNPVNFIHGNLVHVQLHVQSLLEIVSLYQAHYPDPALEIQSEIDDIDLDFVQDDLPSVLQSMQSGTKRIRQIIVSLRNFSRMDESTLKTVDIHEGLDNTLMMLQHRLEPTDDAPAILIKKDYDNLPLVQCAAGELNQVFMNLLHNAIDALRIKSVRPKQYQTLSQPPQITVRTGKAAAGWVQVEIADNGAGMTAEVKDQIFDPFFTTKPVGEGTGMGLPLCYQIITETHQGKLDVHSAPTEGTAVVIQIPYRPSAG
ncbi:MAG: ATP-binding protein [Phormidesmis sp.]